MLQPGEQSARGDPSTRGLAEGLNCVDLFAGAGGFSLAARQAGLRVRLAIENNRAAVDTYRENLSINRKDPLVLSGDIACLDPVEVKSELFGNREICDLMLGGPPCQGFSTHRLKGTGVSDRRNDLIHVYFNFVKAFQPSLFLMENVPGMLWPRHSAALDRFYLEGAMAGYDLLEPVVVDARDHGVPQRRKRVFILGLRRGVSLCATAWPPPPTHGSPAARECSPEVKPWVSCADAFRPALAGDPNDVHMSHSAAIVDAFRRTPPNGGSRSQSGRVLRCHARHDGHKDVYGRIDPRQPAPTMTTACINPSKGRFVHPTLHHGISVRQAARIQTFPDDFVFLGGLMAAGQQIGNAVPVELGRILIEQLVPALTAARRLRSAQTISHAAEPEASILAA